MAEPKYRPSLTVSELHDCLEALEISRPNSSAVIALRIFLTKQSLGALKPTNSTYTPSQSLPTKATAQLVSDRDLPQAEQQRRLEEMNAEFMRKYPPKSVVLQNEFTLDPTEL